MNRTWRVSVIPVGDDRDIIESVAHWNIGNEQITVREIAPDEESEVERLKSLIRKVIAGDWCVTDLQEAIGDV